MSATGTPPSLDDAVSMIFPTPVVILDWPEGGALSERLRALVAAARGAAKGLDRSNVGGWHSANDFILGEDEALAALRARIRAVTIGLTRRFMAKGDYDFRLEGWANVLGAGHYNAPHCHPNATWSGVHYLTGIPGGEPNGPGAALAGKIELFDPRPAAGAQFNADSELQRRCLFAPRPGAMLVFPAWLTHMVHPHQGVGERVSIAFNVTVLPQPAAVTA